MATIREIHRSLTDPQSYPLLAGWMAAPTGPTTDRAGQMQRQLGG